MLRKTWLMEKNWLAFLLTGVLLSLAVLTVAMPYAEAKERGANEKKVYEERLELFQKMEMLTGISWFYLAAVDQYERSIQSARKDLPQRKGTIAIHISPRRWVGFLNPNPEDTHLSSILFFNGMGRDGSGDNRADPDSDLDVLYTFASYLASYGFTENDIRIGLWEYYRSDKIVDIISRFAQIYKTFGRLDLHEKVFPLPKYAHYSYGNTWGSLRGWGGRRMHEGTDIFAGYGTPVRSTCYGYVEVAGWNRFGGWRIGIRDLNNVYHYYAHLSGFHKNVKVGDIVKPGDIIGYVGSSGYGKPGTAGKFPPHLHYGLYKFNGRTEWAFDPYGFLRKWEREQKK
ncbi:L-Ala--D-Glu endopeptidase [Bacillaceae bacterium]